MFLPRLLFVFTVSHVADIPAALANHASRGRVGRGSSHRAEPNAVGAVRGSSNASYWVTREGTPPVADEVLAATQTFCYHAVIDAQYCHSLSTIRCVQHPSRNDVLTAAYAPANDAQM